MVTLSHPSYGDEPLLIDEFLTNKDRVKFIKDVERIVRTSSEYSRWLRFIKGVLGTGFVCYYCGEDANVCNVEIHHHPFNLFDIVSMVTDLNDEYTTFTIAQQVMELHYRNLIGFIPLAKTYHEKFHSKNLSIPMDLVEGNWKQLMVEIDIPEYVLSKVSLYETAILSTVAEKWFMDKQQYIL